MAAINVKSEIKPLKKVLLHRPGRELENLTPDTLERLLFDDIPFLEVAQQEHDAFAQVLRDNGVEVVYLEQLTAEVLDLGEDIRKEFLMQWIKEAGIETEKWQNRIYDFMIENYGNDNKALVDKTFEGIVLNEIKCEKPQTKAMAEMLKTLNTKNKTLFVVSEDSVNYEALLSMSNLPNVLVLFADEVNVYDVVNSDSVVMTLDAVKSIEEVLA